MIGFIPKPINLTYSSVPLENISEFDKNASYSAGSLRRYENSKYIALKDIPQTVNIVLNDTDPLNFYAWDLYLDAKVSNLNSVSITSGVTLVYIVSTKKYYKAKSSGNVDLTSSATFTSSFDDLGVNPTPLYRTKLDYPNGKKDTLLWGYEGVLNRFVMLDEVMNKQTINDRFFMTNKKVTFSTNVCLLSESLSNDIYVNDKIKIDGTALNNIYFKIVSISADRKSFTIDKVFENETTTGSVVLYTQTYIKFDAMGINKIAFFNIVAEKIELSIYTGATTNTKTIDMIDYKWINTFELFCFNEPLRLKSTVQDINPTYTQQFEITFFGNSQRIGELMVGVSSDLGEVEDSIGIDGKIYATIEEANNGDIYVESNLNQNDILDRKQFTMLIDSDKVDYYKNNIKSLLGKPVVISGSEMDKDNFSVLLTYGLIKDYSFKPKLKDEKSNYTFEIREFKEWN